VTQQVAAGFNTAMSTETGPPAGSTGLGAESDIYDCLVVVQRTRVGVFRVL